MRNFTIAICFVTVTITGTATANDELIRLAQNPRDWVMPTGDYANHRYSRLNQINAQNVAKLQVAWTFSTGVLRGHEGSPLVIGDTMYVHGLFPNPVFALDLNDNGRILWKYEPNHCDRSEPAFCAWCRRPFHRRESFH
jgi:glucose dehydrogenase